MIRHDITVMTDWALKLNSHPLPASCQWKHTHTVPAGEREGEEKEKKRRRRRGGRGGGGGEREREREREELYLNMYEEKLYFLGNFRTAKILSVDIFGSVCVPFSFSPPPPPLPIFFILPVCLFCFGFFSHGFLVLDPDGLFSIYSESGSGFE